MLTYKIGISAQEHDDFVKMSQQTNLLQSSSWAKIKDNWGNERIGFYKEDRLVATASILIKPLPLGFTMLYIPRGPIMDYQDKELVAFVMSSLKAFGKRQKAVFVKFDPSLYLRQYLIAHQGETNQDTLAIISDLQKLGVDWTGETSDLAENIQPRFQANIYAEHFSFEKLPKRTQKIIQNARHKGVTIEFGASNLVAEFTQLMKKTENRKQISLRGQEYYQKLLDTYGQDAYITMARLDVVEKQKQTQAELNKAKEMQATFTENTRKTKVAQVEKDILRLESDLAFFNQQIDSGKTKVALAATLSINFGTTSENIYAGMDDDFKVYNPALLTWYETAVHAFQQGIIWQNMGGIENNLEGGLYNFKSKFNPVIEEFAGEFNLPVNSLLYKLTNFAYKVRKKIRASR
ncbi:aminoacyltransferase [Streptococcus plurextorum]|uniref:aminoacyltransferase n=1 Tax=Streptococcus plurextorum TaxID=456876 RepID=UPI0003FB4640|nr:aminoacyltransferase [Streptococcus plurextorum]